MVTFVGVVGQDVNRFTVQQTTAPGALILPFTVWSKPMPFYAEGAPEICR